MDGNLRVILQQLEAEKSIDRETLLDAICSAIESAARKSLTHAAEVSVEVDPETLVFKVFEIRRVVEEVEDSTLEMSLEAALELNPNVVVGNRLKVPAEPKEFGRIAAQTAKQVIIQRIKDAERDNVYEEFKDREGELVTGIVKRINHGNVIVAIGKAEAILPHREQSPRENFKPGDRIRAYLLEVDKSGYGAQLVLSRTSPELVRGLFELEVPEIFDGTIEIKAVAREPGSRTKVAVVSHDANVDPVGACVGMKGSRVRTVVEDLSGEKIDIVRWSEDPIAFCGAALNPADILTMALDEESREIVVTVPYDQLSLAIGKRGQNARLASRLIGWNIDIRSDEEPPDANAEAAEGASEAETAGDAESGDPAASSETVVESGDPAAGSETVAESGDPAAGSEIVVESEDPAAGSETVVESGDPAAGSETVVESEDPAASSETVVESEDPAAGSETVVESEDPAAGSETVVESGDPAAGSEAVLETADSSDEAADVPAPEAETVAESEGEIS